MTCIRVPPLLLVFALLMCTDVKFCFSQYESDSSAPIEITADTMEWLNEKKIAIARGNADAVQGRYTLNADILMAHIIGQPDAENNSASKINFIEAEGNVLLTTPEERARGDIGTYNVREKTVTLTGSVVLTQGDNVLHGEKLVMDLVTGHSRLEGIGGSLSSGEDGRVKAIFNPESSGQE